MKQLTIRHALLGTIALLAAASSLASATPPRFIEQDCKLPAAGVPMRCGEVIVPESRDKPSGRTIALAVQVVLANRQPKQPDGIVVLGGGPGEILTDKAAAVAVGERDRDLILLDQRGVGMSRPVLLCEEGRPEERIEGFLSRAERDRRLAGCAQRLSQSADLSAYSTRENAADVVDVMQALGYEKWNILGVSYGSRLALTVMRMQPKALRSVVLDSPYPPQVNGFDMQRPQFFAQLDVMLADCAANAGCAGAFPNLRSRVVKALQTIALEPVQAQVRSHRGGPAQSAKVGARLVLGDLRSAMYDPAALPLLPAALNRLANGDVAGYFAMLDGPRGVTDQVRPMRPEQFAFGMQLSIQCQDDQAWAKGNPVRGDWPREVADSYGSGYNIDDCKVWKVRSADRSLHLPVHSDVPVLILAGQYDPVTPPELGRLLLADLKNARLIVIPGAGHALTRMPCGRSLIDQFAANPTGDLDERCVAEAAKSFKFRTE
ncbi:alpha/beta hydrolase [Peristeroidobacter soli]|uniref:alpha/beta hydrolase n=1 Tax=Peristeroidobacter soli TaxID=2497877 RepID=UPI00101C0508|nr:alpha/beta hydrolase [Peristeroidobacter soli]